jgi:sortase (surface protein transpeptidase)
MLPRMEEKAERMHLRWCMALGLAVIALACNGAAPHTSKAHPAPALTPPPSVPTPPPSVQTPRPSFAAARGIPVEIVIDKIGVIAPVERVGVNKLNQMDVPKHAEDAAWYEPGPAPGEGGDAVIDGHLNWVPLSKYACPTPPGQKGAVFCRLSELAVGDVIHIHSEGGAVRRFVVTSAGSVPNDKPPAGLFSTTGPPMLTLITCAGKWDGTSYTQRLLVQAAYADRPPEGEIKVP